MKGKLLSHSFSFAFNGSFILESNVFPVLGLLGEALIRDSSSGSSRAEDTIRGPEVDDRCRGYFRIDLDDSGFSVLMERGATLSICILQPRSLGQQLVTFVELIVQWSQETKPYTRKRMKDVAKLFASALVNSLAQKLSRVLGFYGFSAELKGV